MSERASVSETQTHSICRVRESERMAKQVWMVMVVVLLAVAAESHVEVDDVIENAVSVSVSDQQQQPQQESLMVPLTLIPSASSTGAGWSPFFFLVLVRIVFGFLFECKMVTVESTQCAWMEHCPATIFTLALDQAPIAGLSTWRFSSFHSQVLSNSLSLSIYIYIYTHIHIRIPLS